MRSAQRGTLQATGLNDRRESQTIGGGSNGSSLRESKRSTATQTRTAGGCVNAAGEPARTTATVRLGRASQHGHCPCGHDPQCPFHCARSRSATGFAQQDLAPSVSLAQQGMLHLASLPSPLTPHCVVLGAAAKVGPARSPTINALHSNVWSRRCMRVFYASAGKPVNWRIFRGHPQSATDGCQTGSASSGPYVSSTSYGRKRSL